MSQTSPRAGHALLVRVLVCVLCGVGTLAQTPVSPPANKYTPEEDVQLGREADAEVRKSLRIWRDRSASEYVSELGQGLVRTLPQRFDYPQFDYAFTPVDAKEINAFALPGGPMYVNRGLIAAAGQEGELVGVMAHELAHVVLRHGTAQASKAEKYSFGALAGGILGAIVGGNAGRAISQGTQLGIGTYLLKFSREYERDADLLGAQLMAEAGYDPLDLARMFQTIEKSGGSRGPQWLSDHPNPGNRVEYIRAEARQLEVRNRRSDDGSFRQVKSRARAK